MQANNGLKLTARLFLAQRPQLSPNVSLTIAEEKDLENRDK